MGQYKILSMWVGLTTHCHHRKPVSSVRTSLLVAVWLEASFGKYLYEENRHPFPSAADICRLTSLFHSACCARSGNPCRLRLNHTCWVCCNSLMWVLHPEGVADTLSALSWLVMFNIEFASPVCDDSLKGPAYFARYSWSAPAIPQFGNPITPEIILTDYTTKSLPNETLVECIAMVHLRVAKWRYLLWGDSIINEGYEG